MTFLLHLPYSNVVGVILAWLDTSVGLLRGRFCLTIFFKHKDVRTCPYLRSHKTCVCVQVRVHAPLMTRSHAYACTCMWTHTHFLCDRTQGRGHVPVFIKNKTKQ